MDNVFKAIIAAGIINLITGSPIIAMSIGWLVYFYTKQKEHKDGTLT
jgi:hypothetical protein